MMTTSALTIGLVVLLIAGFCALTYLVVKLQTHYNRLTRGVKGASLSQVLDRLVADSETLNGSTKKLEEAVARLARDGQGHMQQIGVVRFNPFSDTGGAQSFTMAILDGNHDGVVMTSLYARTGNRWYVKQIVSGKGKDIELSKEEMAAIQQAIQPS